MLHEKTRKLNNCQLLNNFEIWGNIIISKIQNQSQIVSFRFFVSFLTVPVQMA